MKVKLIKFEVQSRKDKELIDITDKIEELAAASGVKDGAVFAMTMHTSPACSSPRACPAWRPT